MRLKHANKKKDRKLKSGKKQEDGRAVDDLLSFIEGTNADDAGAADQGGTAADESKDSASTAKSTKAAKRERQRKRKQEEKERLRLEKEEADRTREVERAALQAAAKAEAASRKAAKDQVKSKKKDKHKPPSDTKPPLLKTIAKGSGEEGGAMNMSPTRLDDLFSKSVPCCSCPAPPCTVLPSHQRGTRATSQFLPPHLLWPQPPRSSGHSRTNIRLFFLGPTDLLLIFFCCC